MVSEDSYVPNLFEIELLLGVVVLSLVVSDRISARAFGFFWFTIWLHIEVLRKVLDEGVGVKFISLLFLEVNWIILVFRLFFI